MRPVLALAALLVAGVVALAVWKGRAGGDERGAEPVVPRRFEPTGPWGTATAHQCFELQLPVYWLQHARQPMRYGVQFFGPEDDGHTPNVQLYWGPWKKSPEEFFRHERDRRLPGFQDVLEEGEALVAGMPARYLVYEQTATDGQTGERREFLTIDWYFARDGRGGILRGISTARTFRWRYRPVFEEVARRLRYLPPAR